MAAEVTDDQGDGWWVCRASGRPVGEWERAGGGVVVVVVVVVVWRCGCTVGGAGRREGGDGQGD